MNDELTWMLEDLRAGREVDDFLFDRLYPEELRGLTRPHWTMVEVAKRAAEWLVVNSETRVLDVGSGVGKFCIIGALTTPAIFCGVEQRASHTKIAQDVAANFKLERLSFVTANMANVDWADFNAFYFYNPFFENISPKIRMDDAVEYSPEHYASHQDVVHAKLSRLPINTRVVTYHGLGANLPKSYHLMREEFCFSGPLALWVKG